MRILIDLPDEDITWLDRLAAEQGKSRAAVVREAVTAFKAQSRSIEGKAWLDQAFGIWKDRTDIGDPVEWQRRERASATRPWDDDYETVKAEFPDLFDEEDDRQHALHLRTMADRTGRKSPLR
jgi:Arc/MetJ-type ribon-helix-helix transcriptional regulator